MRASFRDPLNLSHVADDQDKNAMPDEDAMITRRLFVGCAALLACAPALAAPKTRDPRAMLAAIYRREQTGTYAGAFGLDPKERQFYLSKALIDLWARADAKVPAGDAGPIDWDVTTNSQGMEVASYRVTVAHQDAAHANLIVTLVPKGKWLRKSPDENIVRYHFIREDGRWVIDDIRGANDAEKDGLKGLLTRAARD
jgi:hypothetical protein